jgi:hypothetical protein
MTWIKWWKNKNVWTIIFAGLLAMTFSILSAIYLIYPYNLIGVLVACFIGGQIIHYTMRKILDKYADELIKKNKKI